MDIANTFTAFHVFPDAAGRQEGAASGFARYPEGFERNPSIRCSQTPDSPLSPLRAGDGGCGGRAEGAESAGDAARNAPCRQVMTNAAHTTQRLK
eukprot:8866674-Pyramimonas_sp.AAC.1